MTDIESAIDHLDNLIGMIEDNQGTDYDADFRLAIRSLEAWKEVLTELEELAMQHLENGESESYADVSVCIDHIKIHLQKLEQI